MCYRDLYEFVQSINPPLQTPVIRNKICQLLPGRSVSIVEMTLDPAFVRGFYLSHRNEDTLFYPGVPPGSAVIAIAAGLDPEWARFIELKELMHLFDDPLQSTNTAKDFEALMAGLCEQVDPSRMSPQYRSELECLWMAMSLLCPEELRAEFQQNRELGIVTDAEIAEILQIPEVFVIFLCGDTFKGNIQYMLAKP